MASIKWVGSLGLWLLAGCFGSSNQAQTSQATGGNPSANLDQCANGPLASPVACTGGAWVNGNLNANQAHYVEGQSVPYRMRFDNLNTGTAHAVRIEWDTSQTGSHAEDYVTTFSRTETTADPCSGVSGCSLSSSSTYGIPVDNNVAIGPDDIAGTADDITQIPGVFTLFGGTITGVSGYTLTGTYSGSSSTSITIHFTTTVANPVLSWGGHISTRVDWKPEPTASSIPGSPYHMRLLDLDGSGGNQDRSLASGAVFANPKLIVIKHVINDNGGTSVASDFTINVTGSSPSPATFPGAESPGTTVDLTPGSYNVTENAVAGYLGTYSADCSGTIAYDETKTCTITNDDQHKCDHVTCAPAGECQQAGTCDPSTGQCVYTNKPEGTSCSDDNNPCTIDACNASGQCVHTPGNAGTTCRASAGACDVAEVCNGTSADCPTDGFQSSTTVCRPSAGACDVAETCTGSSADCPPDVLSSGNVCRPSAGACDLPEVCSGTSAACPPDQLASGNICRPSAGACDVAEVCSGTSASCPPDGFQSGTTVCRPSAGACDVAETCTGNSASCPSDTFQSGSTVCRPSAGPCDVAETCTGNSASCPSDTFQSGSTVCRPSAGDCDVAETCTGSSAACPSDGFKSGNICRASAGACDVAETCSGSSATCPTDTFQPSTTVCRASAGDCDVAETCTGNSASCPSDSFSSGNICRPSAGDCDVAEKCSGTSASCPPDGFSSGNICRPSAGDCDVPESCSGTSASCPPDGFQSNTTVCRPSAGDCDVAEKCTGSTASCPSDGFLSGNICRAAAGPCDVAETCSGSAATCPTDGYASQGTVCRPSTGSCDTAEVCSGTTTACPPDVGSCALCGNKFYDANASATWDTGEPGVSGWKITITSSTGVTTTTYTDSNGTYNFTSLADGDYTICEATPLQSSWMQLFPADTCYHVTMPGASSNSCTYNFGNLCLGAGGGHTPGFWSNKNGAAAFSGTDHAVSSLAMLVALNLKNDNGTDFDPTTWAQFAQWLLQSTAVNMAYKLSTHLAAMELNVKAGFVDPSALVYAPGTQSANSEGFATISALMAEANTELAAHPLTTLSGPTRTYQEALKDALDAANNNQNFVQEGACTHTFQTTTPTPEHDGVKGTTTASADADPTAAPAAAPDEQPVGRVNDEAGCSSTSGSQSWFVIALMSLVVLRSRRRAR
jgi:uncharacterized protein (TIGR03382 family)